MIEKKIFEESTYEKSITAISKSRLLVLNKYNLFAMLCEIANRLPSIRNRHQVILKPANNFS